MAFDPARRVKFISRWDSTADSGRTLADAMQGYSSCTTTLLGGRAMTDSQSGYFGRTPNLDSVNRVITACAVGFCGMIVVIIAVVFSIYAHDAFKLHELLRVNGVASTGYIVHIDGLTDKTIHFRASFKFPVPSSAGGAVVSFGSQKISLAEELAVRDGRPLRIIYDSQDPSIALIDFRDDPAKGHGGRDPITIGLSIALALSIALTTTIALILRGARRTL